MFAVCSQLLHLLEQNVDRHSPSRDGWFSFSHVTTTVYRWIMGIARSVDLDNIIAKQVYIPHHQSAGCEIVAPFFGHLLLCSIAVIVFAPYFNGELGGALKE